MWPHQGCKEGKDHLPQPADNRFSHSVQNGIDLLCHNGTSLAHVQLSSTRISTTPFFQKLLTCLLPLHVNWRRGLFLSKCWALHFLLLNLYSPFNFPVIKQLFISCSPISLACLDPFGCQHDSLMYQPLLQIRVICKESESA